MSLLLKLVVELALLAWGVGGTEVYISYADLPDNVTGLAYGNLGSCWIEIPRGFSYIETQEHPDIAFLVGVITHELGHCFGFKGIHSEDPCSIMFHKASGVCRQGVTNADRLRVRQFIYTILESRVIVPGVTYEHN